MPTAYWAGGTSTDTNTAANWVDTANGTHASNPFQRSGVDAVPNSADDVIIQSTSNSNVDRNPTQNAAHTFNSIKIEAGGEWTADGSNHLTISGEDGNDFAFTNNGTYTHANGTVVINNGGVGISHAAIKNGDATSTTGFYDLTISGGGTTCEIYNSTTIHRNMEAGGATTVLRGALTVNGNLDVVSTLNTRYSSTDYNLTVLGTITVSGTLTCNGSTINNGSASSSAGDLVWSGTINLDTCTFNYYNGSSSNFNLASCTLGSNTSTVNIIARQTFAARDTDLAPGSGNLHHLTFSETNSVTGVFNLYGGTTIGGDLTIGSGTTLSTSGGSAGDNKSLTVGGELTLTGGTLTCNDSDVIVRNIYASGGTLSAPSDSSTNGLEVTGEGTSGGGGDYSIRIEGATFTDNNGTVILSADSNTFMRIESSLHNFIIRNDGSSSTRVHEFINPTTIGGDLTLTNGHLQSYNQTWGINVTGDVLITKGQLGRSSATYDSSFGSLTIESGGTYSATSGTTTITKGSATAGHSGQPSAIEVKSGGTFTNNNGTVLLSSGYDQDLEFDGTGNMYNLTINKSDNDVIHNSNLTIEGNLDITLGGTHTFRPNTGSRTVTVYGNTYLTAAGGGGIGNTTQYTGTNNWGLVTINSGEFILSTGTNNVSGIRNIGGTVSQS